VGSQYGYCASSHTAANRCASATHCDARNRRADAVRRTIRNHMPFKRFPSIGHDIGC
jgi:hypothetical protein